MRRIKNLVVGTGPAGIAAVKALRDLGQTVEVIDIAYDLDTSVKAQVDDIAHRDVSSWNEEQKQRLFPPPIASSRGVERRFHFGSDFPYRVPDQLDIELHDCKPEFSHGLGGLGNVWGAALLPYSERQLRDWPISRQALEASYANILRYMPISAEKDDLEREFPLFSERYTTLKRNGPTEHLMNKLSATQPELEQQGIAYGRARLAVESGKGRNACQYCGYCLDGCAYQSIFNPRLLFESMEREGLLIHRGLMLLEVDEQAEGVSLITVDVQSGELVRFVAERVYLAAGHFATTTILARSLKLINQPIPIQDSQYFFFPFFSYKGHRSKIEFTLAEAFLEMNNEKVSSEPIHLQLYGRNQIIEDQITGLIPTSLLQQAVLDRLYIVQGFLSSKDSGGLELMLSEIRENSSAIRVRGIENSAAREAAARTQALLRRTFLKFGLVPPLNLNVVPPGRSFHTGGSFPMGGKDPVLRSDVLGRPAHFNKVHIVDSANFSNIAGSTIAFTIMANADRIVRALH